MLVSFYFDDKGTYVPLWSRFYLLFGKGMLIQMILLIHAEGLSNVFQYISELFVTHQRHRIH